jgi:Methyltransferase domain
MSNFFDERIAKDYDARWPEAVDPSVVQPIVDFLAELADGGPALELAIGTGRIAIPLIQRGVMVHGIELSAAMVNEMRKKPDAERIGVTIGDMATTKVGGTFKLVYLVANTIANLTTQDAQVACFENAAYHLESGGRFVIELYIPALRRLPPGQTVVPFILTPTHLGFEEYDVATQIAYSHHYWQLDGQWDTLSAPFRYVWPSELDLMARIAGLTLRERWANWSRAPFTSESPKHVSVWEKNG